MSTVHSEDMDFVLEAAKRLEETGAGEIEYRVRNKQGEYRWVSNHLSVIKDSAGRPLFRDGMVRDITERKKAEAALKESEARANALIKYAPTGIYEIDYRISRIISVNEAMSSMSGYTREEFLSIIRGNSWMTTARTALPKG